MTVTERNFQHLLNRLNGKETIEAEGQFPLTLTPDTFRQLILNKGLHLLTPERLEIMLECWKFETDHRAEKWGLHMLYTLQAVSMLYTLFRQEHERSTYSNIHMSGFQLTAYTQLITTVLGDAAWCEGLLMLMLAHDGAYPFGEENAH